MRIFTWGGAEIGNNVHLGAPSILGSEPYLISIGDNTYFSGLDIQLITHDGSIMQLFYMGKTNKKLDYLGKIKIGKNCFIGSRVLILKNVELGDNCIVGAGAVVTKSFPSNSVIAGIPAKLICTTDEFYNKNKIFLSDTFGMSYEEKRKWCEQNRL